MTRTKNRAELVAELLSPYKKFTKTVGHDMDCTAEWALVCGAAEIAANTLLSYPGSDYWRCAYPLETAGDGAALRWLRETLDEDPDADGRFGAYARTPGCDVSRKTADITRWFFQSRFSALSAIAYASPDGDYPIHEDFAPHVRERMILGLPAYLREEARWLANNYTD